MTKAFNYAVQKYGEKECLGTTGVNTSSLCRHRMTPAVSSRCLRIKWVMAWAVVSKVVFKAWLLRLKANLKPKDLLLEEIRPKELRMQPVIKLPMVVRMPVDNLLREISFKHLVLI